MKKIILVKLVCLSLVCSLQAQQIEPDRPILDFVTVDPSTGHVTLNWYMPPPSATSVNVDEFVLFWYEHHSAAPGNPTSTSREFARIPISEISGPPYIYTFDYDALAPATPMMPDPRRTTVTFAVSAANNTPPNVSTGRRAYENDNVQVVSAYDSCNNTIRLRWHPYRGWFSNTPPNEPLTGYRVMRMPGGNILPQGGTIRDTTYLITNAEAGVHTYYIEAVRADGTTSTSYRTTREIFIPRFPSYIKALNTQYNEDGHAEITFEIDPAGETHGYRLYGSSNNITFVQIEDFVLYDNATLTDYQNHNRTYYYKLEAMHFCSGQSHIEFEDEFKDLNVATALWLIVEQDGLVNYLRWDSYQKWANSDAKYDLYRKIGDNPPEIISNGGLFTTYVDDLTGQGINEGVCYWIEAAPAISSSSDEFAISNTVCVEPESEIFIPNAFIPNSINENAEYKPTLTFPPAEYMMVLYDRTGAKVFETRNPDEGWNGRLMNNRPANEGVYTYVIRYRTSLGMVINKRGTFVLIMP